MKKIIIFTICTIILTGCMSKREEKKLNNAKAQVIEYLNNKYNQEFVLEKLGYIYHTSLFATRTENMYFITTDGLTVIYYANENRFADDGQTELIKSDLKNQWKQVLSLLDHYEEDSTVEFNEYYGNGDYIGSYFTNYYDGNIKEYIKNEKITIHQNLFVLTTENQWQKKLDNFCSSFYDVFGHYKEHNIQLVALSDRCYQKYQDGIYRYPGIDMNECFAEYHLSKNTDKVIQNYIDIGQGIYVTSATSNFELQEGDIVLEKVMNKEEFLDKMKELSTEYQITMQSDVYRVKVSKRVQKLIGSDGLGVYMKCDYKEMNIDQGNKLYYYPNKENKEYNYSFNIYSDHADAEFHNLKETDYFWIGIQEKNN